MRRLFLLLALALSGARAYAAPAQEPFMEQHESLKRYLFQEPASKVYLSFGISPLAILSSRILFSIDLFQVNVLTHHWDIELLSASFGFGMSKDSLTNSRQVLLRTTPKFRLGNFFSVGPMVGLEYVSFPNVQTKIFQGTQFTPDFEPFSQTSWIYGLALSETFTLSGGYLLKVNELFYKENYSTVTTKNGWQFFYNDSGLQGDTTPIQASTVIALEFALLF